MMKFHNPALNDVGDDPTLS